jgi:hypothetical protein
MQDKTDHKYKLMEQMMKKLMTQNKQLMKAQETRSGPPGPPRPPRPPRVRKELGDKTADGKTYCKCGSCNKIVIHKDDDCFELEKNAHKRPSYWWSNKAWQLAGLTQTGDEEWRPGIIANINGNYDYLVAPPNYWAPLEERSGDEENNSNRIFDPGKEVTIKKVEMLQASTEQEMRIEK